jgi:hypothetical protein
MKLRHFWLIVASALCCRREGPPTPVAEPPAPVLATAAEDAAPPGAGVPSKRTLPTRLPGAATEVSIEDGDVMARDASGHEARLTDTGRDLVPVHWVAGRSVGVAIPGA